MSAKTPYPDITIVGVNAVLLAIADGGQLWRSRHDRLPKYVWLLRPKPKAEATRVFAPSADSAVRQGLIEPTGMLYWRLTQRGKTFAIAAGAKKV